MTDLLERSSKLEEQLRVMGESVLLNGVSRVDIPHIADTLRDLRAEVELQRGVVDSGNEAFRVTRDEWRRRFDYAEAQRDDHRAVLNRFADRLRVVHEDPKIEEAVFSAIVDRDAALARVRELERLGMEEVERGLKLEARLVALREALTPFAKAADTLDKDTVSGKARYGREFVPVTANDYFNARAALAADERRTE